MLLFVAYRVRCTQQISIVNTPANASPQRNILQTTNKYRIIMKTNYIKPATTATRHNGLVNHFAKLNTPKGVIFGFIDCITPHGLGFIYANAGNVYGCKVLHASDAATLCTTPADLASARTATRVYFQHEEKTLKAYLARCTREVERKRVLGLIEMLAQIRRNAGV